MGKSLEEKHSRNWGKKHKKRKIKNKNKRIKKETSEEKKIKKAPPCLSSPLPTKKKPKK